MHWHFDYHDHHGTVAQAGMIIIITVTGPGAGPAWPGSLRPGPVAVTVTLQLEITKLT